MLLENCELRKQYPEFIYKDYSIKQSDGEIKLEFSFEIPSLGEFHPSTVIKTDNIEIVNPVDSESARAIAFSVGMTECVSYFKAVCPERLTVKCRSLSESDIYFWKKLYFNGLGEFFYRNGIEADFDSFLAIEAPERGDEIPSCKFEKRGFSVVPVGGGKDSAVTAELLKKCGKNARYFTVNDQQARTDTVYAAGGADGDIIKTYRTIDPFLLELNRRGFLNGHTPFSAIVAFLSAFCAYISGGENIILSNEASANEANVRGVNVNHQYSKSYDFEKDFSEYIKRISGADITYFSLLRPFSELQIAKYFSRLPQYHGIFRSCNAGSKKNIWCGKCPKCLFVYSILSPFIEKEKLDEIFGGCMFDKTELEQDFKGLAGLSPVKPFECVGTSEEFRAALSMTVKKYGERAIPLPPLLEYFDKAAEVSSGKELLSEFNSEHGVPDEFLPCVKEMYSYVSESR